jgi:hypothetical protein
MLLTLNIEEESMNQGVQETARSGKGKGMDNPLESQKVSKAGNTLRLAQQN